MEKVELTRADVLREIVKTNRSNMPERINIISIDLNLQRNGKLKMTSRVLSPTANNELFYLDNSTHDTFMVKTVQEKNGRPYEIEAVVPRFSEALIEVSILKEYSDVVCNGVYKYGSEFYIPSPTKDDVFIHLVSGKEYRSFPEQKCIVYGQFNGHCCAIASASDAKKLKLSLYAVRGVEKFDNAEWSKDVHCGMYEELLRELLK